MFTEHCSALTKRSNPDSSSRTLDLDVHAVDAALNPVTECGSNGDKLGRPRDEQRDFELHACASEPGRGSCTVSRVSLSVCATASRRRQLYPSWSDVLESRLRCTRVRDSAASHCPGLLSRGTAIPWSSALSCLPSSGNANSLHVTWRPCMGYVRAGRGEGRRAGPSVVLANSSALDSSSSTIG